MIYLSKGAGILMSAWLAAAVFAGPLPCSAAFIEDRFAAEVAASMAAKVPAAEKARLETGVKQAAGLWKKEDGAPEDFKAFCEANFVSGPALSALFRKFENKFEFIWGYMKALSIEVRRELDEDRGELQPVDKMFANFNPGAHFLDDAFKTKLAFVVLLNFPIRTLQEAVTQGASWSREAWAGQRLAQTFSYRVPAEVQQKAEKAYVDAEEYVNNYDIQMDHVAGKDGKPMFREGLKLISHWGLRDELEGFYSDPAANLAKQKAIQVIMERIIAQEIPKAAVGKPVGLWDPAANTLDGKRVEREPDTRYEKLLDIFHAERLLDPHYPNLPTRSLRSFELEREIPEPEVERLLEDILKSKEGRDVAAIIRKRVGRKLEPFDIWYSGFRPRGAMPQEELDAVTRHRFPTREAFQKDIPNILLFLGFDKDTAAFLASKIELDPARGGGHASQPEMKGHVAHLRAKVGKDGMDYQGFATAMHELGHCVEMVFSLYRMDHYLLRGVPNSAFSESFAFVFQSKSLDVLGLAKPDPRREAFESLDRFWSAREISGVALVDMRIWRWMYGHPDAKPEQVKKAVMEIAREVWDKYYAPVLGTVPGDPLLAIYSHIIVYGLYIPNYPLGYIIAGQVEDYFKTHPLGRDMERMCVIGRIAPSLWMKAAVGAELSAEPMTKAVARALRVLH